MPVVEARNVEIKSIEDLDRIIWCSEREFASFLLTKPKAKIHIIYEPKGFCTEEGLYHGRETVPDFYIYKEGEEDKGIYIELTLSKPHNGFLPKSREKNIMRAVAPTTRYKVYHGDCLSLLQKAFPEFNFFVDGLVKKDRHNRRNGENGHKGEKLNG